MLRVTKDLQEILRNGANVDRNRKCLDQLASKSELLQENLEKAKQQKKAQQAVIRKQIQHKYAFIL